MSARPHFFFSTKQLQVAVARRVGRCQAGDYRSTSAHPSAAFSMFYDAVRTTPMTFDLFLPCCSAAPPERHICCALLDDQRGSNPP